MAFHGTPEKAAHQCCKSACSDGQAFKIARDGISLVSDAGVRASFPRHLNPGATNAEWIAHIAVEGTPEDIAEQLQILHKHCVAKTTPPAPSPAAPKMPGKSEALLGFDGFDFGNGTKPANN